MAIIFVDSTASGTNAGTSWTNAYTSLNNALTAANIAPGDNVLVSGTFNETVTLAEVAAAATPNIVQGDDKSGGAGRGLPATFTIDGQSTRANCLVSTTAATYYSFEDMICTGATSHGVSMASADVVTFKRCRSHTNVGNGFLLDDVCSFEECQADNNSSGYGISCDATSFLTGCVSFANSLGGYDVAGGILHNCIAYGMASGDNGIVGGSSSDYWIINCTVDGENVATTGMTFTGGTSRPNVINSIVYDCVTGINSTVDIGQRKISRNNLVNSNSTADYANYDTFSGEVTSAPGFTGEAGDDYSLASGSAAKAAGFDAGELNVTTVGSFVDIGAVQREEPAGGGGVKMAGDGGAMVG